MKLILTTNNYPLSSPQREIWFDQMLYPDVPLYNVGGYVQINGSIDPAIFESAVNLLVQGHDALRTVLVPGSGEIPVQTFLEDLPVTVPFHDFSGGNNPPSSALAWMQQQFVQPFDLYEKPLFYFALLKIDDNCFFWLMKYHHLIVDGWGISLITQSLAEIYTQLILEQKIEHAAPSYLPFVENDRAYIESDRYEGDRQYWLEKYGTLPEPLLTPRYLSRFGDRIPPADRNVLWLHRPLYNRLLDFAKNTKSTPFHVMLGALYVDFTRTAQREELAIGLPILNRSNAAFKKTVGLFIGVCAAWFQFGTTLTFRQLLKAIGNSLKSDYRHQRLPVSELNRAVGIQNMGRMQLFDIQLNYAKHDHDTKFGECKAKTIALTNDSEQSPLSISVWEFHENENVQVDFVYNLAYFNSTEIESIQSRFVSILEYVLEHVDESICTIPLLTEAEQQQLAAWNRRETDYPGDRTIVDLFRSQVEKTPDNIAVVFEDQQLSYGELNRRTNRLAHYLGTLGVGSETLVGLCVERSLEMVTGLLGILKAGGAYVPLDPDYPLSRLQFMLEDSKVAVLLSQGHLLQRLPVSTVKAVCLDSEKEQIAAGSAENPERQSGPENPAYVIYTSGSTGIPKGVMVEHSALSNFSRSAAAAYLISQKDRVLQFASINFDAAAEEIYPALTQGGCLILRDRAMLSTDRTFLQTCRKMAVTILDLPTAYWQQLIATADNQYHWPDSVRLVIIGGEAASIEHVKQWRQTFGQKVQLLNTYGPTEATVVASSYRLRENVENFPIGKPTANTKIHILDTYGNLTPIGIPGELCIAGAGLARGYLNNPELTNDKFQKEKKEKGTGKFFQSDRLYKTGDLARWLPDGNLEYLGRLDRQVKLRGFRIELSEIEAVLSRHEAVKEAVVVLAEDNPRLFAYVTLAVQLEDAAGTLRNWLKNRLPEYMLPAGFSVLDRLPLTPTGKIDRKALPNPAAMQIQSDAEFIKPQTPVERQIAEIWQEVLKLENVGIHDNFFDLGGHSLLAMQVQSRLQELLDESLPIVKLFQYPTVQSLAAYIARSAPEASVKQSKRAQDGSRDIAVIGMAGRFPAAPNIEVFWNNLREGLESIQYFSDEEMLKNGAEPALLSSPGYVKAGGVLEDAEFFDAHFFGYSPKEAEILDPQQRLFLEAAWASLEHAGYDVSRIDFPVGVFAGAGMSTYMIKNLLQNPTLVETFGEYQVTLGGDKDFIPSRTAYKLNLKGPALSIHAACSTSLAAVHLACQSLLNGECEMALAGGVSVLFPQGQGYLYQEGMIASPDGHCRAFDASAHGTVGGGGVGVVVLKRPGLALADGDSIHALVKGSAVNNDGMGKVGFTAPSVDGQASVISEAMRGLDYESISLIEAHGTGTLLGDPIEIKALTQAYRRQTQKKNFCALGSVKTNVGHLDSAAGVTGLIKAVLALKHREIPPSLHFEKANPQIDLADSPFFVNTGLRPWQSPAPLRAGVNSSGMGGTNVHVIVEEAPVQTSSKSKGWQLVCLSAQTETALKQLSGDLADYLASHPELNLADMAYTLNLGRKALAHRGFMISRDLSATAEILRSRNPKDWRQSQTDDKEPQIVFMFPGQGAQYVNMAAGLYKDEPLFRAAVDECARLLEPHLGLDLRELLYSSGDTVPHLEPTQYSQPALFVTEYALAKLCMARGIEPVAMIGHSIGEYVAACLAGVFSLSDALQLVAVRGKLMQAQPPGKMLSLSLPKEEFEMLLSADLSIAAHNAPNLWVVSGSVKAIDALTRELESRQIEYRPLHTSHAFHSPMMEPVLPAFREQLRRLSLHPPQRPYISNLTGTWITAAQATSADYWCGHLRHTVRFSEGIQTLQEQDAYILLELGPGRALSSLARQHQAQQTVTAFNLLRPATSKQDDKAFLLDTLGQLWLKNVTLDWPAFYTREQRLRIPLPTYPFERQRYWIDPTFVNAAVPVPNVKRPLDQWFYLPGWKRTAPLSLQPDTEPLNLSKWLIFTDEQGLGSQLGQALEKQDGHMITVQPGETFQQYNDRSYRVNPHRRDDYEKLFDTLAESGQVPDGVLHLWSLDRASDPGQGQIKGFYSLMFLAQTWPKTGQGRYLFVVSDQLHTVTGGEELHPLAAALLGPVQTISPEYPDLHCRSIDIVRPDSETDTRQSVTRLLEECQFTGSERLVAFRSGQRWVRTFEPVRLPAANPETATLRREGVYLITGGLGGIGLSLAAYLAETVQARLVLIGRSAFPGSRKWDEWLGSHADDDTTSIKIRRLRELQRLGAEVAVLQADVANREQIRSAVEQAKARFDTIHGVIHAAGVSVDEPIEFKTTAGAEQILSPKVQGSVVLAEQLEDLQLDFMAFCSSLNAMMEIHGRVDYCGANAFQDAFAQALYARGVHAVSINWDGWQEVGMAVNIKPEEMNAADLQAIREKGIKPVEGVEAFARILARSLPQVMVSTTDWHQRLQAQNTGLQKHKIDTETSPHHRPALTTGYVEPNSSTERKIAEIWQLLLGIEPIGIYDDFFELGGHSLLMTQLILRLHETFSVKLPMQTLFEFPTIAALAEEVDNIQSVLQKMQKTDEQSPEEVEEIEL